MEMLAVTSLPSSSEKKDSERQIPTVQEFLNDFNEDDKLTIAASRLFHFDSKKKMNV